MGFNRSMGGARRNAAAPPTDPFAAGVFFITCNFDQSEVGCSGATAGYLETLAAFKTASKAAGSLTASSAKTLRSRLIWARLSPEMNRL
jgi:hypothetical protein